MDVLSLFDGMSCGQIETKIEKGDCLEILKKYPDNFFNLIVTSPRMLTVEAKHTGELNRMIMLSGSCQEQRSFFEF